MRKSIIIALIGACCLAGTARADRVEREDIGIGFRGGLNISSSFGSYKNSVENAMGSRGFDSRFDTELGGHFGVITDIGFTNWFYLQPGVFFTTKSFDFYVSGNNAGSEYSLRRLYELYYLEIPVVASFRVELARHFDLQLNVGGYVACGVGGNVSDKLLRENIFDIGDFLGNPFESNGGDLHRFDAGLQFGIGFTYKEFYLGASYDLGLFNIATGAQGYSGDIRTSNIMVSIGYTIQLDD